MAEVRWIKLSIDMFDNSKIKFIRTLPNGNDVLLIWIMLLTQAGKCNARGYIYLTENIPYTSEMLSAEFNMPITTIQLAVETLKKLKMLESDELGLCITGWEEHQSVEKLDAIREYNRLAKQKSREKQKLLSQGNVNDSQTEIQTSHDTDIELDKEKELYIVEQLWSLYPNKQGKAKAITKIPKLIKDFSYEQIERTIQRYIEYVEFRRKTDFKELKFQNGSTFFNNGYVDYLDENFQEETAATKKSWWQDIDS